MRVAIIGMGVVGRGQAEMFGPHVAATYDITDEEFPGDAIDSCDFAIIATGTPALPDGQADLSQIDDAMSYLDPGMPVLIRSTVPPGATDLRQVVRTGFVAYAPEFLYEGKTGPWHRSADVPFMLLGGRPEARAWFRPHLRDVFPGPIRGCPAVVAELAKYTANLHWATQVTFVNEMASICDRYGVSWEDVRGAWLMDRRISPDHTAMAGFGPGFGGRCWPKDLAAMIAAAAAAGYKAEFLAAVQAANGRFRDG